MRKPSYFERSHVDPLVRSLPCSLPAWMVVLDTTLCKQGALSKAPRDAERDAKDTNVFCRNDFWTMVVCKPTTPLPVGKGDALLLNILTEAST